MAKILILTVAGLVVLAVGTVGLPAAGELAQVYWNRGVAAVEAGIPLDVQIERLELLQPKVDHEASQCNHEVAKLQIDLEDAKSSLCADRTTVQSYKENIRRLRGLPVDEEGMVTVGCQQVSYALVRNKMASQLGVCRVKAAELEAREKLVATLETACNNVEAKRSQWNSKREALKVTISGLRARQAALKASAATPPGEIDSEQLVRAQSLADKIERQLRVAERQQALDAGSAAVEALEGNSSAQLQDVEAEVDALLGVDEAIAVK